MSGPRHRQPPSPCLAYSDRRQQCQNKYGKEGENCLLEELEEKRCISFEHCPREAKAYYGHALGPLQENHTEATNILPKATCSLWAESFAYSRESMDPQVVQAHQDAQQQILASKQQKKECQQIVRDLARCLQVRYRR